VERQGGGLRGRRDRIALPGASLQAGCEAARVFQSQVKPGRCVKHPGWVEAGRPAGAIAPVRQEVRCGSERVPDGEPEVAQRGFVGVDAQDFCGSRGALRRQAGAQRPGGGRIDAQGRVEPSEPGASEKQRRARKASNSWPPPLFVVLGCVLTGAADSKETTGVWFEIEHVCARPRSRD